MSKAPHRAKSDRRTKLKRTGSRTQRDLDALQIEEYIATNTNPRRASRRDREARQVCEQALIISLLLRAAGIKADGNNTAAKVKTALAKVRAAAGRPPNSSNGKALT